MTFSVKMPALGESVTEGTVTRWLKKEGEQVALDEPLLEVSTDKVDTEIPSPAAGVLQKIVVAVDQVALVGAELAVIADGAATAAAPAATPPVQVAPVPTPAPVPPAASVPTPAPNANSSSGATLVVMPALGESVSEGTVTRWLKAVGDQVSADEPLLEVSTDKVDTEIPAPTSGTLLSIDVAVDSTVPVGARLATIGSSSAAPASTPAPVAPAPVAPAPAQAAPVAPKPVPAPPQTPPPFVPTTLVPTTLIPKPSALDDSYVTPIVRKLAAEIGVDLSRVKGTGVGGRIRKEDVLAAVPRASAPSSTPVPSPSSAPARSAAPVAASPLRGTKVTMTRLRKVIAARMLESLQVSAQLTTVVEVDITKIARV
jgi:2-oxoglutarate dehydrogenase E2 component (dihydrolipoamide succinyltransferase)